MNPKKVDRKVQRRFLRSIAFKLHMDGGPISFVEKSWGPFSSRDNYNGVLVLYKLLNGEVVCLELLNKINFCVPLINTLTQNSFHIETCTQNIVLNIHIHCILNYCNNPLNNLDFFFYDVLPHCTLCLSGFNNINK